MSEEILICIQYVTLTDNREFYSTCDAIYRQKHRGMKNKIVDQSSQNRLMTEGHKFTVNTIKKAGGITSRTKNVKANGGKDAPLISAGSHAHIKPQNSYHSFRREDIVL